MSLNFEKESPATLGLMRERERWRGINPPRARIHAESFWAYLVHSGAFVLPAASPTITQCLSGDAACNYLPV
jgi:hypothetical protein